MERTSLNNEINLLRGCQLPPLTVMESHESINRSLSSVVISHFLLINVTVAVAGNIVLHVSGDLTKTILFEQRRRVLRPVCHVHIHVSGTSLVTATAIDV